MERIDVDKLMKADTLVYKHTQTNLEKNVELYCKYGVFAIAVQDGKYAGCTMVAGTKALNKKNFEGLKTSLFKKEVNVQLYFVCPTFIIDCALDDTYAVAGKNVRFKGKINAKLELADPVRFVNFVQDFSKNRSGIILTEENVGSFIITAMFDELIPKNAVHRFVYEKNEHGGITRETYLGQLMFRSYFNEKDINRYTSIGLRERSITVDAKEVTY